jgi:hypothetical protein
MPFTRAIGHCLHEHEDMQAHTHCNHPLPETRCEMLMMFQFLPFTARRNMTVHESEIETNIDGNSSSACMRATLFHIPFHQAIVRAIKNDWNGREFLSVLGVVASCVEFENFWCHGFDLILTVFSGFKYLKLAL